MFCTSAWCAMCLMCNCLPQWLPQTRRAYLMVKRFLQMMNELNVISLYSLYFVLLLISFFNLGLAICYAIKYSSKTIIITVVWHTYTQIKHRFGRSCSLYNGKNLTSDMWLKGFLCVTSSGGAYLGRRKNGSSKNRDCCVCASSSSSDPEQDRRSSGGIFQRLIWLVVCRSLKLALLFMVCRQ